MTENKTAETLAAEAAAAAAAEAATLKADEGEMKRIEEARLKLKKLVAGNVAPE
jgi:hypothetical protein